MGSSSPRWNFRYGQVLATSTAEPFVLRRLYHDSQTEHYRSARKITALGLPAFAIQTGGLFTVPPGQVHSSAILKESKRATRNLFTPCANSPGASLYQLRQPYAGPQP